MVTPTPTAGPLQAAMVGFRQIVQAQGEQAAAVAMAVEAGIDRPAILGVEGVGAARQIGAGAEAAARAGEHHGAHVVVAVGAVHGIEQFRSASCR